LFPLIKRVCCAEGDARNLDTVLPMQTPAFSAFTALAGEGRKEGRRLGIVLLPTLGGMTRAFAACSSIYRAAHCCVAFIFRLFFAFAWHCLLRYPVWFCVMFCFVGTAGGMRAYILWNRCTTFSSWPCYQCMPVEYLCGVCITVFILFAGILCDLPLPTYAPAYSTLAVLKVAFPFVSVLAL